MTVTFITYHIIPPIAKPTCRFALAALAEASVVGAVWFRGFDSRLVTIRPAAFCSAPARRHEALTDFATSLRRADRIKDSEPTMRLQIPAAEFQ